MKNTKENEYLDFDSNKSQFEDFFVNPFIDCEDTFAEDMERNHYAQAIRRDGFLENYIKRHFAFHLHFTSPLQEGLRSGRDMATEQGCIILEYTSGEDEQKVLAFTNLLVGEDSVGTRSCQRDRTMLVPVGELAKEPQGALLSLLCSERLQRLDDCYCAYAHALQHSWHAATIKTGFLYEDGELNLGLFGGLSSSLQNDELENKIIQRAPEIVKNLPDHSAPHRREGFLNANYTKETFGLRICLSFEFICVILEKGFHLDFQTLELLACPLKFETNAI
jgi:hypothetical protein